MKSVKKIGIIFLFACIIFFVNKIDVFAMAGGKTDTSDKERAKSLLSKQMHELVTDSQIEEFYQYFMTESSWAPGKVFPYSNNSGYKYTISDGVYTYNAGGATGCKLYAQFVSGVVYGKHSNKETDCTDMTEVGVKEFFERNAQFGEHIRVESFHSIVFLASDDNGFYGLEYWDDAFIHFVYYSYSKFIEDVGNRRVFIYDIDTVLNPEKTSQIENPESTFQTIDGNTVSSTADGSKEVTIIIFGKVSACSNTYSLLSEISKSGWILDSKIRVIFVDVQQADREAVRRFANQFNCNGITFCFDIGEIARQVMWKYLKLFGLSELTQSSRQLSRDSSMVSTPVTVMIDSQNLARTISTGYQTSNALYKKMNYFAKISGNASDREEEALRKLTFNGEENYYEAYNVLDTLNQTREAVGKSALKMDESLLNTAMTRAAELSMFYSHIRPDGSDCYYLFRSSGTSGENIAVGYRTSEAVMEAWNNSPGHYANIISDHFTSVGIGCFVDSNGTKYWAQCFDNEEAVASEKSGTESVTRTVSVRQSLIHLDTESSVTIRCNSDISNIQMSVSNLNSEYKSGSPELSASNFNFTSSNPQIAEVDEYGWITVKEVGTAVITAALKADTSIKVSKIITKNHLYNENIIAPTYTSQGYTRHICEDCGDFYDDTYMPMLMPPTEEDEILSGSHLNPNQNSQMNFNIVSKSTSIKGKIKAGSKGFTVKWKKQSSVTGYQVQYSTSKKFIKKTTYTKTVNQPSITKLTIQKLKEKKRYFVRIRTYRMVNGKKYTSVWSKAKSVKTKS